jgi:hypothetical protein
VDTYPYVQSRPLSKRVEVTLTNDLRDQHASDVG